MQPLTNQSATFRAAVGAMKRVSIAATIGLAAVASAQVNVVTYHNDNLRTGLNDQEKTLNLSNVNSKNFGLLFRLPVDGQVYAQPLYLSGVSVPRKGKHNVVYVATEHNSVYAYDADSNTGANAAPLWKVNFGVAASNWDFGSGDITNEIGITGTPVIIRRTSTLYVVTKTKEAVAGGEPIYVQRLHALDISTGKEKFGGPVVIDGQVNGTGEGNNGAGVVPFNSRIQMNRCALVSVTTGKAPNLKDTIYIAFGSHGDNGPYHGWVFAYDGATLSKLALHNTTPNALTDPSGYPLAAGGLWQGGAGPASDGMNLFYMTGNGMFDPTQGSYGDAFVRLGTTDGLFVADYFAPTNQDGLNRADADLGSGGVLLLPKEAGNRKYPALAIGAGKEGTIYLLDRSNLGKFDTVTDHIVAELPHAIGGIWGIPAYFNNRVYFGPIYSGIQSFGIKNAAFTNNGASIASTNFYTYPGCVPAISSDGLNNGIVWSINANAFGYGGNSILFAHDAAKLGDPIYRSDQTDGRDELGGAVKFAVPTIANGKVYAGTATEVDVFGLGQWVDKPTITPAPGTYNDVITVSMADATPGAKIYYTLDGSAPTVQSTLYTAPFTLDTAARVSARAFADGYSPSGVLVADYLVKPFIGRGTGLLGSYFANTQDPSGTPTKTRLDPTVDFQWDGAPPIDGVGGDNWAASWTGKVQPLSTGKYTFYTNSDDGVRLTVNGQKIIDNWTYHAPTDDQGTVTVKLIAGRKYTFKLEFFQGGGGSVMHLYWSAPGIAKSLIPKTQLYPQ
jgi:PA14 domain/Chitobiase/beta-hexosaminidase C-terminal domain